MALIVQKFGGTSVGTIDRIKNVAQRALDTQAAGNDVVVIVSAMTGETNRLLEPSSPGRCSAAPAASVAGREGPP